MIIHLSSLKTDYEIIAHSHASDRPPHHSKLVKNTEKNLCIYQASRWTTKKFLTAMCQTGYHTVQIGQKYRKTLSSVVVVLKSFNIFDNEFSLTGFIRWLMWSTFQAMVLNVLFVSKIIIECSHHKNWKIRVV